MMWVDHSATSPYKDRIYVCWHNGNPQYVNTRTSTGWGTPKQISGAESTGTAIGCDVKTNANGDAFVFWPTTGNSKIVMSKSTNGGSTWTTSVIATTKDSYDIGVPSFNSRRALIYVSAGAYRTALKNMVYATWTDLSGASGCTAPANEPGSNVSSTCKSRIWFTRSADGGATWSAPAMVNNQASNNDQFNQWMGVDETTGRLVVIYYDTVGDAGRKKTDIWYQTSADDGATWSAATKISSAMTDETIAGADSGNQYGDYNSLSIYAGKIFPSWTDRRNNGKEEIWTAPITEP
jgi:Neuraminidase (sialidase)